MKKLPPFSSTSLHAFLQTGLQRCFSAGTVAEYKFLKNIPKKFMKFFRIINSSDQSFLCGITLGDCVCFFFSPKTAGKNVSTNPILVYIFCLNGKTRLAAGKPALYTIDPLNLAAINEYLEQNPNVSEHALHPEMLRIRWAHHRYAKKPLINEDTAIVCGNEPIGGSHAEFYKIIFKTNALSSYCIPQFCMLSPYPAAGSHLQFTKKPVFLGRPFAVYRAASVSDTIHAFSADYFSILSLQPFMFRTLLCVPAPDTYEAVYKVLPQGEGTNALSLLKKGDTLTVRGPLGSPFPWNDFLSKAAGTVLLAGGGVGLAPLTGIARELAPFLNVRVCAGMREAQQLSFNGLTYSSAAPYGLPQKRKIFIDDMRDAGINAENIFTIFETSGEKPKKLNNRFGLVTDLLTGGDEIILSGVSAAILCGPEPMMKSAYTILQKRGIPVYVLMEKRMGCGFGVCFSCVCGIKKGEEKVNKRVCIDGPLFNGETIDWEKI